MLGKTLKKIIRPMTVDDIKHEFILAIVEARKSYIKNKDIFGKDELLTLVRMGEFVSLSNLFIKLFSKEEYKTLMKEHFSAKSILGESHTSICDNSLPTKEIFQVKIMNTLQKA